jgi:hypothetical protein
MDAHEPHVRRRGFFLHSTDGNEPDTGDHENPEGFGVRVRSASRTSRRQIASSGRARTTMRAETTDPQIRSGSVTGSRQRAHLPR